MSSSRNTRVHEQIEAQERQLQELESAKSGAAHQQEVLDLRHKLQSTTEQLLRKQTSLTELQTERSALRATIQDLKVACRTMLLNARESPYLFTFLPRDTSAAEPTARAAARPLPRH